MPPQAIEQFIAETSGMTPGYAGFRPEAGDAPDLSKFGGVVQRPAFHDPWAPKMEPNDPFKRHFEWRREKDIADAPPSYRESVGGVKSGYTGYVPRGLFKIGTTHMGGSSPWESPGVPYAQTGHEGYKISAPGQPVGMAGESEVTVRRIPKCTVSCISHRYPGCPRQSPSPVAFASTFARSLICAASPALRFRCAVPHSKVIRSLWHVHVPWWEESTKGLPLSVRLLRRGAQRTSQARTGRDRAAARRRRARTMQWEWLVSVHSCQMEMSRETVKRSQYSDSVTATSAVVSPLTSLVSPVVDLHATRITVSSQLGPSVCVSVVC